MYENSVILAIIGIIASLIATLSWVVKRVFEFSEAHAVVVANNTKSNDAVAVALQGVANDLKQHADKAEPAITASKEVMVLISTITKTLERILDTQKEIIEMVRGIKREP